MTTYPSLQEPPLLGSVLARVKLFKASRPTTLPRLHLRPNSFTRYLAPPCARQYLPLFPVRSARESAAGLFQFAARAF